MKTHLIHEHINKTDRDYYEQLNQGWSVQTNDCLCVDWENGSKTVFVIFCGPFTLDNMCRDCGSYFELSTGGNLYRIDKETLIIELQPNNDQV